MWLCLGGKEKRERELNAKAQGRREGVNGRIGFLAMVNGMNGIL